MTYANARYGISIGILLYLNNGVHTALLKTRIGGWDTGVLLTVWWV